VCVRGLGFGDLAHGVVEGQAEDLGIEVGGIAGQVALGEALLFFLPFYVIPCQLGLTGIKPTLRVRTWPAPRPVGMLCMQGILR
jgi:hypothetical protein